MLGDHLGSTSVLVNQNGTLNATNYYFPYGDNRGGSQSTLTTKRFTGQYHEAGIGLYYYNARWYDSRLARFTQADMIVPDPASLMSLNRYMYVLGNPLRYRDPSGHRMVCGITVGGACDDKPTHPTRPIYPPASTPQPQKPSRPTITPGSVPTPPALYKGTPVPSGNNSIVIDVPPNEVGVEYPFAIEFPPINVPGIVFLQFSYEPSIGVLGESDALVVAPNQMSIGNYEFKDDGVISSSYIVYSLELPGDVGIDGSVKLGGSLARLPKPDSILRTQISMENTTYVSRYFFKHEDSITIDLNTWVAISAAFGRIAASYVPSNIPQPSYFVP